MAVKIKAGTHFSLPVIIEDDNFDHISSVEFLFTQTENGETIKTAYWSKYGICRDCGYDSTTKTFTVVFTLADSYLFTQGRTFFMDTRVHYDNSDDNPYTRIITLTMDKTLFKDGEVIT